MYKLYKDKPKNFKCVVEVEGASIKDTHSRIVLTTESNDVNLLYFGTVSENGECNVPINKLGDLLEEDTKGKLQLEVIVDGAIFTPWQTDFVVETSKKVRISEVNDTSSQNQFTHKPKVNVSVIEDTAETLREHANKIKKIIRNFRNKENKPNIDRIIQVYENNIGEKINRKEIKKLL